MDPGIAEFNNFSGFNVNKVIVLSALVGPFKLSNVLAELMFNYQITIQQ